MRRYISRIHTVQSTYSAIQWVHQRTKKNFLFHNVLTIVRYQFYWHLWLLFCIGYDRQLRQHKYNCNYYNWREMIKEMNKKKCQKPKTETIADLRARTLHTYLVCMTMTVASHTVTFSAHRSHLFVYTILLIYFFCFCFVVSVRLLSCFCCDSWKFDLQCLLTRLSSCFYGCSTETGGR